MEEKVSKSLNNKAVTLLMALLCTTGLVEILGCGNESADLKQNPKHKIDLPRDTANQTARVTTTKVPVDTIRNKQDTIISPQKAISIRNYLIKHGPIQITSQEFGTVSCQLAEHKTNFLILYDGGYFGIDGVSGKDEGATFTREEFRHPQMAHANARKIIGEILTYINAEYH